MTQTSQKSHWLFYNRLYPMKHQVIIHIIWFHHENWILVQEDLTTINISHAVNSIQEDKLTIKRFILPQAPITERGIQFAAVNAAKHQFELMISSLKRAFSHLCRFRNSRIKHRGNAAFPRRKMFLLSKKSPSIKMNGAIFISFYLQRMKKDLFSSRAGSIV